MRKLLNKKGQLTLGDAPTVVLLVGLVFLVMATIAFIGEKYGNSIASGVALSADCNVTANGADANYNTTGCGTAYTITGDLNTEIGNNTSIAGIVLTISLVGIVLSILIGVFIGIRGGTNRV